MCSREAEHCTRRAPTHSQVHSYLDRRGLLVPTCAPGQVLSPFRHHLPAFSDDWPVILPILGLAILAFGAEFCLGLKPVIHRSAIGAAFALVDFVCTCRDLFVRGHHVPI
jgi:hypothetical protein